MQNTKILYKKTIQTELSLYLFDGAPKNTKTPTIVFFMCGGWHGFDASKLFPQSQYFASRGIKAFVAEVRSTNQHKTTPTECVIDAKSAIRWVRENADKFNVSKNQIIASGGSAAGHVSLCSALLDGFEDPSDNLNISSKPNYLCLFNPVVSVLSSPRRVNLFGENAIALDPMQNINEALPPTLIMQGDQDEITPLSDTKKFIELCKTKCTNQPELNVYEKEGHGFFNWFDGKNKRFYETTKDMDLFLLKHNLLQGSPTMDETFHWEGKSNMSTT